jgi:hypothetical protein
MTKRCPQCGGQALFLERRYCVDGAVLYRLGCMKCGYGVVDTSVEAAERWFCLAPFSKEEIAAPLSPELLLTVVPWSES